MPDLIAQWCVCVFSITLQKLLPRYNSRPGRRLVRKNVVVQRQLPLLPKTIVTLPKHDKVLRMGLSSTSEIKCLGLKIG